MLELMQTHLTSDDDPELWRVATLAIGRDIEKANGLHIEFGCCAHWIRPHDLKWQAPDGGFAVPVGYNPTVTGYSYRALPGFEWSVILQWQDDGWEVVQRRARMPSLRIAVPARTARHMKAAVHTLWMTGKAKAQRFYGLRRTESGWSCTEVWDPRVRSRK